MKNVCPYLSACGLVSLLSLSPAYGLGTEQGYHDVKVVARGNAGVASATSAAAVYYNPALLGLEPGAEFQSVGYLLDYQVEHRGAGGKDELRGSPAVAASFFTKTPLWDGAALGIGLYMPFGQRNEWRDSSPLRSYALDTELIYMAATVALGWEAAPGLRLGVSASAVTSRADFNQGLYVPGDKFSLDADGQGWGLGAGFSWDPLPRHRLAGSVRWWSPIEYEGHTTTKLVYPEPARLVSEADAELDFPLEWTFGYAYQPNEKWLFEVDVIYTEWSDFDKLTVNTDAGGITDILDWRDSVKIAAGVTRSWDSGWWVGAGYWFAEITTPDQHFNPRLPDLDLHVLSLGTGYRAERWAAEFTYQFGYGNTRRIHGNNPTLVGATADGKLTYQAHGFAAGFRWFW